MAAFIKDIREANAADITTIKGDKAAEFIAKSGNVHVEEVQFDEAEASRLGLKLGDYVAIAPEDNGAILLII